MATLEQRVSALETEKPARFDRVEQRLDRIELRLDRIEVEMKTNTDRILEAISHQPSASY